MGKTFPIFVQPESPVRERVPLFSGKLPPHLKYGALSSPNGRVCIECKAQNNRFSFTWREIGGPPTETPANKGFGTVLLVDMAKQFAEAVKLDYLAEGLFYHLETRLDQIEEKSSEFFERYDRRVHDSRQ